VRPAGLVAEARRLLETPSSSSSGWWSRAAVLLARQALEARLAELVSAKGGDPRDAPFTAQLLVLPELLGDAELAGRVAWAWTALSRASHHHGYELAPTSSEVARWLEVVELFISGCPTSMGRMETSGLGARSGRGGREALPDE
jgi:hypothetical protein